MKVGAIVVAAGFGVRFKSKTSKPLSKIGGKPSIVCCLQSLEKQKDIKTIVIVVNEDNVKDIKKVVSDYKLKKVVQFVNGGKRRQDSVFNGLNVLDKNFDFILIHDAARPFIDQVCLKDVLKKAYKYKMAILAVPVKPTIKEVVDGFVTKTLNRDNLWEIQTPQVFERNLLVKSYEKFANHDVTDDAFLMEKMGLTVRVVMGSYDNIKLTTLEDLELAQIIAKKRKI